MSTETRALIEECRAALAEELAGWDLDPPLHHVKQAHDRCVEWLAAHPAPMPPTALTSGSVDSQEACERSSGQEAPTRGQHPIPVGTIIFHDHGVYRWPDCSGKQAADPDALFDISLSGDTLTCRASGFGAPGDYGNGSVLIKLAHWKAAHTHAEPPREEAHASQAQHQPDDKDQSPRPQSGTDGEVR